MRLWDIASGKTLHEFDGFPETVHSLDLHSAPQGPLLLLAVSACDVSFFDLGQRCKLASLPGEPIFRRRWLMKEK